MHNMWVSRFSFENFQYHRTEELREGTLLCCRKHMEGEKHMDKRGSVTFSVGKFLFLSAEKHRGGALLCFRTVVVSEFFWMIAVA